MAGSFELRFSPDHPTAAGHFPGRPIIPGALLLDAVRHAIFGPAGDAGGCKMRSVKFLHPVRPGDAMRIDWREAGDETHFECTILEIQKIALTGSLSVDRDPG